MDNFFVVKEAFADNTKVFDKKGDVGYGKIILQEPVRFALIFVHI